MGEGPGELSRAGRGRQGRALRVLAGRVVVREAEQGGLVWLPPPDPYTVATHRGVVLASGVEGVEVGAGVIWHWEHHEGAWTAPWPGDGRPAAWLPGRCVDAVLECAAGCARGAGHEGACGGAGGEGHDALRHVAA